MRRLRRFLAQLGPGLVTGAADDDPSGVVTYSIAGARYGTALLWTALLTWPLMTAVQLMCSRVGMVTGRGLVGALRQRLPSQVILIGAVGLLAANTINIGADLSAMADAAELFTGLNSHLWVLLFGAGIAWATVRLRYAVLARALKWLTLALLAYVVCAIYVGPDWGEVARATFLPSRPRGSMWSTLVAILGTTISPYLFFWQASQEVEEERAQGRRTVQDRQGASTNEIRMRTVDVLAGTFASNLVMYFIILTTAITLHQHGIIGITTSREAMVALEPIAGRFASALYAFAIIGVGLLAVPTLSGSAAYALAELFHWRDGLDLRLQQAPAFYGVVLLASLGGVAMDFFNLDPIGALYWSAVINGVLAPFLLAGVLLVASDSHVMALQPSSLLARGVVLLTILCMTAAAVGMFVH
ncbi:MAG TPA: divalent metal cation transporter [Gemmatimonadales bacterium]|jgi:Mn2+/Fe2+ NRAMP family transporter|nr:divalent metal cation transporter [Gemmatimonadales bacterium]